MRSAAPTVPRMDKPTHPYVEAHEGWFSTTYVLRSPSGEVLASFEDREAAEDLLRDMLGRRESKGLLSWLF